MVKQLHPVNFDITNMQLFYGRNKYKHRGKIQTTTSYLSSFVCSRLAPHEQMNNKSNL